MRFWPTASVSCEVCSIGCPSWLALLFMSLFVLHLLLSWGGLVTGLWPYLQLLCVGLFWGLCRLSLWSHPLLMLFLAWVFFLWRLFGLGLVGCGSAWVPAFFWGNSPSLVLVFAWRFLQFGCPGYWSFPEIFAWVLSSRFQCLLIAWGGYGWTLVIRSQ